MFCPGLVLPPPPLALSSLKFERTKAARAISQKLSKRPAEEINSPPPSLLRYNTETRRFRHCARTPHCALQKSSRNSPRVEQQHQPRKKPRAGRSFIYAHTLSPLARARAHRAARKKQARRAKKGKRISQRVPMCEIVSYRIYAGARARGPRRIYRLVNHLEGQN